MNTSTILVSAVFIWKGFFGISSPANQPAVHRDVRQSRKPVEAVPITMMDRYDRYLAEPEFQLNPTRNA